MKRRDFVSATVSVTAIAFAGCTSLAQSHPDTPEAVTEALMEAMLDGDYETVTSLMTDDLADETSESFVDEQHERAERSNGEVLSVELQNETEEEAEVQAKLISDTSLGTMTNDVQAELVKEDGKWFVSDLEY